jgi:hypothetical protein
MLSALFFCYVLVSLVVGVLLSVSSQPSDSASFEMWWLRAYMLLFLSAPAEDMGSHTPHTIVTFVTTFFALLAAMVVFVTVQTKISPSAAADRAPVRDMAGRAGPAAGDTGALHGGRAPAFVFAKHILVEMGPSGLPILTFRVAPATAARRYLCPQLRCHVLREAALPDGELLSQSLRVAMDDDDTASFPGDYLLRHTVSKRECVWLFGWHMT